MQPQRILLQSSIASIASITSRVEDHGENAAPDYIIRTQSQIDPNLKRQFWIVEEAPPTYDDNVMTGGGRGSNHGSWTSTTIAIWSVCFCSIVAILICVLVMAFLPNDPPKDQQATMTANACCTKRYCRGMGLFERCWLGPPQCPCPGQIVADINANNVANIESNAGSNGNGLIGGRALIIHTQYSHQQQPQSQQPMAMPIQQQQHERQLQQQHEQQQQQFPQRPERYDEGETVEHLHVPGPDNFSDDFQDEDHRPISEDHHPISEDHRPISEGHRPISEEHHHERSDEHKHGSPEEHHPGGSHNEVSAKSK